jgi:hypothetical protein
MEKSVPPRIDGNLRKFSLRMPEVIWKCSGIVVFGRRIKSLAFTTDLAILRNINADAILAVYPFTPQPVINQALLMAAEIPVFAGVGGGLTKGKRVIDLAHFSEMQGATGVVVNAPTAPEVIEQIAENVDIPIVVTVTRWDDMIHDQVKAGAAILNVAAASGTPEIVACLRREYPDMPIIASGGPTDETILQTISAGANAISWTPPSNKEVFSDIMAAYRDGKGHP